MEQVLCIFVACLSVYDNSDYDNLYAEDTKYFSSPEKAEAWLAIECAKHGTADQWINDIHNGCSLVTADGLSYYAQISKEEVL